MRLETVWSFVVSLLHISPSDCFHSAEREVAIMLRGGPPRAPAVIKHGKTHAQLGDHYYELCRGWLAQAAIAKSALAAMGPPRPDSPSNDFQREEMESRMKWAEYYASSSAALSRHHRRLAAGIIDGGEPFERRWEDFYGKFRRVLHTGPRTAVSAW